MFTGIAAACALFLTLFTSSIASAAVDIAHAGEVRVEPTEVVLNHAGRHFSLIVNTTTPEGLTIDLTLKAKYKSADATVATVDEKGWIHPVADGKTQITVFAKEISKTVDVEVKLPAEPTPVSFRHDIEPVISKAGCNMGACHGYSLGKNGFKLSLRGSDPDIDYAALTNEFFERRVNRQDPAASLMLAKPMGDVKHEGGMRFKRNSLSHKLILQWITEGAAGDIDSPVHLESVEIYPKVVVLSPSAEHHLQLTAKYSDGSRRDVTQLGIFNVNNESIAGVDDEGLVTPRMLGETAVVARFERIFATTTLIVLQPDPSFKPAAVPTDNIVDAQVIRKLNDLRVTPSDIADDATFLRRVSIDLIGVQPRPDEVLAFVKDTDAKKREKMVDALMQRPDFVDWWSLKWGDLLQNSRARLTPQAMYAFREWIRAAIRENKPLDQFARELLTGSGGYLENPTSAYFAISKDTDDTIQRATEVFCGVRMLCAKCHAHPFENWTQADYYGLHSFFNQVVAKPDTRLPGIVNARTVVLNLEAGFTTNPRSGKSQAPRYLGGVEPKLEKGIDRRQSYATWLTSRENPYFARSLTNRVWSYFFSRGIIDPVDDIRTTNPPINPELLDALTKEFVDHNFDVRHLMRSIVLSRTYQRSSISNPTNAHDDANFSRAIPRRMPAEALLDALVQATGVQEAIGGAPAGFNAAQLPDPMVQSDFLSLFGKPSRAEACECERDSGSNMLQALTFINGKSILGKVDAPSALPAQLVNKKLKDEQIVEQLYLWTLARPPTDKEKQLSATFFKSYDKERLQAAQDLMWALLNSRDFVMVN
jgi:hypothetical protein